MKDKDKHMQHAMFSFALLGNLLAPMRGKGRHDSRPQDSGPAPRKPR